MKKGLILYAGIGGFRHGVRNFPGWEWTAVELDPAIAAAYKSLFPNDEVIVADAQKYLLEHIGEFDFIQSSPPCQTHSKVRYALGVCGNNKNWERKQHVPEKYPDAQLMQNIIFLATSPSLKPGAKWIVENVMPYYERFIKIAPYVRCRIGRHYIWSNSTELVLLGSNKKQETPTNYTKSKHGRVRQMNLRDTFETSDVWFSRDVLNGIKGTMLKRQMLRNMFEPELAEYCFEFITRG